MQLKTLVDLKPARAALIALGALAGMSAAPALAKGGEEIVVIAPYTQTTEETRSATGAEVRTHTLRRLVTAEDLDLRDPAHVELLEQRVAYTARAACRELDRATHGIELTTNRECVHDAIDSAEPQIERAVAQARYAAYAYNK